MFNTIRNELKGSYIYLAVAAIFGIIVPYLSYHPAVVLTAIIYFYLTWRKSKYLLFLCFFSFFLYLSIFLFTEHHNVTSLNTSTTSLPVTFIAPLDFNGDKLSTIVETSTEKLQFSYKITTSREKHELQKLLYPGVSCTLNGKLTEPQQATNPNAFDYHNYLYKKGIHWIFTPDKLTAKTCSDNAVSVHSQLLKSRQRGVEFISSIFPQSSVGIVQALIFGERGALQENIVQTYQSLGIVHLLAISGLHIGLMTGMIFFICVRIGLTREHTTYFLLCFLPVYTVIAGGAPSVTRASLMSMLLLVSIRWNQRLSPIDAISIACLLMIANNPYVLFEVGFQLSFVVSFSLVLSSKTILKRYQNYWLSIFILTVIAQLSAFPILLFYFYEISLLSIPINILFVPLFSVIILPASLVTFCLLVTVKPVGVLLVDILTLVIDTVNKVAGFVSNVPFTTLVLGKPSVFIMYLYSISIILVLLNWESKKRVKESIVMVSCVILFHFFSPYFDPNGEVAILDVGQGDAIYIELPYRKAVYVFDTGGSFLFEKESWQKKRSDFSVGEDILLPYLKSNGVRTIDRLLITHGDLDHIGGASSIIASVKTKQIILGKGNTANPLENELITIANKKRIDVAFVEVGDKWTNQQYEFFIVGPVGEGNSENDHSVVVYTSLGGIKWLFTGDLEENGERELVKQYPNLHVDVLKVGHHGSKTSTSELLLQTIRPRMALISVGRNNRYQHPHQEVINRLEQEQIMILRTDENGAIRFIFNKKKGTFVPKIP